MATGSWLTMVLDTLFSISSSSFKSKGRVFPWFLHVSFISFYIRNQRFKSRDSDVMKHQRESADCFCAITKSEPHTMKTLLTLKSKHAMIHLPHKPYVILVCSAETHALCAYSLLAAVVSETADVAIG